MLRAAALTIGLVLLVAACVPTRTVPGAEPVFYAGDKDDVFAAVLQAISTSPGLDNSNGWIINDSDQVGGFIRALTVATIRGFWSSRTENHSISVIITQSGEGRTQVVIQRTSRAKDLADRISAALDQNFTRVE